MGILFFVIIIAMTVIPAINAPDFKTAKKQIEEAAEFSDWIHIDVTDGVFSPAILWGSPEELKNLVSELQFWEVEPPMEVQPPYFEVHLMVSNPEGVIDAWLRTGVVKRVIVHLEAMTDSVYILAKCKKYGVEAMLAINPGTEVERLLAHKDDFDKFQVLAVQPGWAGQKFDKKMIDKIKFIRQNMPDATPHITSSDKLGEAPRSYVWGAIIEVDGGINPETAKLCKKAGADIVVSASYIFGSKNPKKAYEELASL